MTEMTEEIIWMFSVIYEVSWVPNHDCFCSLLSSSFSFVLLGFQNSLIVLLCNERQTPTITEMKRTGGSGEGSCMLFYVLKKIAMRSASNPLATLVERTQSLRKPKLIVKICCSRGKNRSTHLGGRRGGRGGDW